MTELDELRFSERLLVYRGEEQAGELVRLSHGCRFTYDAEFLAKGNSGIALQLPSGRSSYETHGDVLHPFFAGLLPEGRRLTALVRTLKTSEDDLFTLLAASGADVIGDISVRLVDNSEVRNTPEILHSAEVNFFELFERSIQSNKLEDRNVDSAISGILPKISAQMISFPVSVAASNRRYILKLSVQEFPNIVENEHLMMQLARRAGLKVAPVKIVTDKDRNMGLLVERFDRLYDSRLKRFEFLHQEDACQFLGRYPADKYRLKVSDIMQGIFNYASAPIVEGACFIQLLLFSYLITNGDLHAKNISLLQSRDRSRMILAPAYDLVATLPYNDDSMALQFEGRTKNFKLRDFLAFGERWNIPAKSTSKAVDRICTVIGKAVTSGELKQIGFSDKKTSHLEGEILQRIRYLRE